MAQGALVSGIQGFKRGMVDRIKGQEAREEAKEDSKEASSSVISRHPEGKTNAKYEHDESGFLWSWNFMISKRWKNISNTGATGDISFMDKLLADFRQVITFIVFEWGICASYWSIMTAQ